MNVQQDHVLHSRDGKFADDTSHPEDVARILKAAATANQANGLVIHFHGGLVCEKDGRGIADFLAPKYWDAGAYPLFFVWESGFIESLKNNLQDISQDPAFRELVKKVSEWALKKLGGQVGLKGAPGQAINEKKLRDDFDLWFAGKSPAPPVTDEGHVPSTPTMKGAASINEDDLADDIEAGLDADPDFQNAIQALHNAVSQGGPKSKGAGTASIADVVRLDNKAIGELFPGTTATTKGLLSWISVAKFVAKVVIAVLKRYAAGRAHGMYCTVVEEVLRAAYLDKVGATVWNQMKKDTADSFGSSSECCGTDVLNQLQQLASFPKITLVGHSTGAVYICNFLDAAARIIPNHKFDIIFLAPAVRHERFAAALQAHAQRIEKFRMFGMSDELESNDVMVPILYTRSLLYFVSGLLEGHTNTAGWTADIDAPIVGMQRYVENTDVFDTSDFPEVEEVREFLNTIQNSTVWSEANAGDGLNSQSHSHGDFDNDPQTVASVLWQISH
ncbi:MAG: DUF1749 domain-containing protein [Betaproteobacteria bacterium HGW-Betaproteobacteria-6]|jgi:hypothetical protein|nr:MAG: DUF1749 domain-containing protein [Betaproteobacteria bacterium HGW-Betaproteobacteria-6]